MENIELVIKIPKKFYEKIKYGRSADILINNAIKNGTPLDKIRAIVKEWQDDIWNAPTIIEADKESGEKE